MNGERSVADRYSAPCGGAIAFGLLPRDANVGLGAFNGGILSSSEESRGGRLTTWTLGAIKERNFALEGYCQTEGCGRFYVFDVDNLIATAGADYVVPDILPGIVCTECSGALKFKLAMVPPDD